MFTQVPAPATTTPGSPTTASSSPRPSRLRGLSYLRNYTQTHLLSREHSGSTAHSHHSHATPSSPTGGAPLSQTLSLTTPPSVRTSHLYRTTSASAATSLSSNQTTAAASSRTNSHRLTLVNPESHPLSLAPAPRPSAGRRATDSVLPPIIVDLSTPTAEPTTATAPPSGGTPSAESNASMVRTRSATMTDAPVHNGGSSGLDILPSIRFSTFYDPRAARPSLTFTPIARTLPTGSEIIRVGRYSERDSQPNVPPNVPSAAPVGFKSKVVSRRHCEFWYEEGKWYIKDVKSSSGTFLNHIRLSPPGTESKPFPINDGDIVQLGIDFKGGEEMIFRCVKMRLELNRGWQNKLNTFNLTTHKRLRNLTASSGNASTAQTYSQDCSICLNSIAPCQCLFVAPCSHTWHYKCIRSLLSSPSYPIFICPNCRAAADLEADVEDPEEWEHADSEEEGTGQEGASLDTSGTGAASAEFGAQPQPTAAPRKSRDSASSVRSVRQQAVPPNPVLPVQHDEDAMDMTIDGSASETLAILQSTNSANDNDTPNARPILPPSGSLSMNATSSPMPIPTPRAASASTRSSAATTNRNTTRTPSPISYNPALPIGHEGPITPRNDAGPWVFDGSGVRTRLGETMTAGVSATSPRISSLDAAANGDEMILDEIHVKERA